MGVVLISGWILDVFSFPLSAKVSIEMEKVIVTVFFGRLTSQKWKELL
jgi:hypothetical protein